MHNVQENQFPDCSVKSDGQEVNLAVVGIIPGKGMIPIGAWLQWQIFHRIRYSHFCSRVEGLLLLD